MLPTDTVDGEHAMTNTLHREDLYISSGPDTTCDVAPPTVQETEVQTDPLTILEEEETQAVFDVHHQNPPKYVFKYASILIS